MTAPRWEPGALKAAHAGAKSWQDAADRYNAATGVIPPKSADSILLKCRTMGLRANWEVVRPDSADDRALREAIRHAVGWANVAEIYNAATGESRTTEALKTRAYSLGLKLARKAKPGPEEGSRATECDPRDILLRAQRIRLYKECHAIRGRRMTAAEMDEALDTDPTGWPDPPPPGRANCSGVDRGAKVYRMRLPRGVAS